MTPFAKRCELAALEAELAKMRTYNDYCNAAQTTRDGPMYEREDFDKLSARMRALAEEPQSNPLPVSRECATCRFLRWNGPSNLPSPCAGCGPKHEQWQEKLNRTTAEPCSCEEAEELKHGLESARAEVASLTTLNATLRDCLGKSQAEVERARADRDSARAERDTSQNEAERLKMELASAQDRLPAWAKAFVSAAIVEAMHCPRPDCKTDLCEAWRNLTPDQRRQCEEP